MALVIFPDLIQRVQICIVLTEPFMITRTFLYLVSNVGEFYC